MLPITDVMIDNTYDFKRMSFMNGFSRLEEPGATYQSAMSTIFRDHQRKTVEYYVDNIAIKSHDKNNHLHYLKTVFNLMRAH